MTMAVLFRGRDIAEDTPPVFVEFNITLPPYNAVGDNSMDCTVAIRSALADAIAHASPLVRIIVPTGIYKVCRQPGDPAWPAWPILFNVAASNKTIEFQGDGKALSTISAFMPGMLSPNASWVVTGDGFVKIARFTGFEVTGTNLNVRFRAIEVNGNFTANGDHTVGGVPATGAGWDISHKGIRISSGANMEVEGDSAAFRNWAGEVWWGGNHNALVKMRNGSELTGSNASALSVTDCDVDEGCIFGGTGSLKVYNGIENFAFDGEANIVKNSTFEVYSNAVVPIGRMASSATITGNTFNNCPVAILLAEGAWNVLTSGNTFNGCANGLLTTFLNLYPGVTQGFGNFEMSSNIQNGASGNVLMNSQATTFAGYVRFLSNTINGGSLLSGSFGSSVGLEATNNIFAGGKDHAAGFSGKVPLWSGSVRPSPSSPVGSAPEFASCGNQVNVFGGGGQTTGNFAITSDLVALNDNQSATTMTLDLTNISSIPDGFTCVIKRFNAPDNNWFLVADPSWNNFSEDLAVTNPVTLTKVAGLFQVVP